MRQGMPVCARTIALLKILAVGIFAAHLADGSERSTSQLAFQSPSTLDAEIAPVELAWRPRIADLAEHGILRVNSTSESASEVTLGQPLLMAPQNATEPIPTEKVKPSPFEKWISPESSHAEAGDAMAIASDSEEVPQVARRILQRRQQAPTPSPRQPPMEREGGDGLVPNHLSLPTISEDDVEDPALEGPSFIDEINPLEEEPVVEDEAQNNLRPLNRQQLALRSKVRRVLTHYYNRPLNTRDRSPWELMHGMLAYEVHSKVLQGGPNGQPITAVGWLCYNQAGRRRTLMYVNDDAELRVRVGPALQGHRGQFLALLAQCKVKTDYPMLVDGHELTIEDLIEMEMKTCYPNTELTFKLIGLNHYLDPGVRWVNEQGMQWSVDRLVAEEVRQPIRGAACGGTHRLSGLTLAYKTRQKQNLPIDGEYLRAQRVVAQHMQYAYGMQNPDGSFSTEWFKGRGNRNDVNRKLQTTGHILEWLLYAVTERELHDPRTTRAVSFLATILQNEPNRDWEAGPLGHALHALYLYDRLAFQPYDDDNPIPVVVRNSRIYQASNPTAVSRQ